MRINTHAKIKCPNCGSKNIIHHYWDYEEYIFCLKCGFDEISDIQLSVDRILENKKNKINKPHGKSFLKQINKLKQ